MWILQLKKKLPLQDKVPFFRFLKKNRTRYARRSIVIHNTSLFTSRVIDGTQFSNKTHGDTRFYRGDVRRRINLSWKKKSSRLPANLDR